MNRTRVALWQVSRDTYFYELRRHPLSRGVAHRKRPEGVLTAKRQSARTGVAGHWIWCRWSYLQSLIEDVLKSHRFHSGEDLEQTILRYVHLYNSQLPQSVLKGQTPVDALKDWQRQKPELFSKRVYNHAGCDR